MSKGQTIKAGKLFKRVAWWSQVIVLVFLLYHQALAALVSCCMEGNVSQHICHEIVIHDEHQVVCDQDEEVLPVSVNPSEFEPCIERSCHQIQLQNGIEVILTKSPDPVYVNISHHYLNNIDTGSVPVVTFRNSAKPYRHLPLYLSFSSLLI